jgi:hypothetical protein
MKAVIRCRRHGDKNRQKSLLIPILCFSCNRPWMPFIVGCSGKYRNLSAVLKHFLYPIADLAATPGTCQYVKPHSFPSTKNNNNHHHIQSSTINPSNNFPPKIDLIHSTKRKLTYPSPNHGGDPGSPISALSVSSDNTYTASSVFPSSAGLDERRHPPKGKLIRDV